MIECTAFELVGEYSDLVEPGEWARITSPGEWLDTMLIENAREGDGD